MSKRRADILMYHSISDRGGPTSIAPDVFRWQMEALAASRRPVVSMDRFAEGSWPDGAVALTFDDAFQDFSDFAWPILERHDFPAMVYVPTGYVGGAEGWTGALSPPRPLMDWPTIRRLAKAGVEFGNHSVSHPDLSALDDTDLQREICDAKEALEGKLGSPVRHCAPPYGSASATVRKAVARCHVTSVGTVLGQVTEASDLLHLPRIEMFYFRTPGAWRRHLDGNGGPYLALRRGLRAIRSAISPHAKRGPR